MSAVFNAVVPVFALILVGYLSAKRDLLGDGATDALNRFVVYLALPALLFQAMAQVTWAQLSNGPFIAAFGGGMMLTFALWLALDWPVKNRLTDASIEALAAAYPNTGFMGIPLCLIAFGRESLPAVIVATLLTVCLLMAFAIVLIETDLGRRAASPRESQGRKTPVWARTLGRVARSLGTNPLLIAPFLGLAFAATGFTLPAPILGFTTLLGAAASPCALVTIGLFLAQSQPAASGGSRAVTRMVALKLFFQPALTAILALRVFPMAPTWAHTAILIAALPIGTGPFMVAKLYDRDAAATSRAILLTTLGSIITISVLLALFRPA